MGKKPKAGVEHIPAMKASDLEAMATRYCISDDNIVEMCWHAYAHKTAPQATLVHGSSIRVRVREKSEEERREYAEYAKRLLDPKNEMPFEDFLVWWALQHG